MYTYSKNKQNQVIRSDGKTAVIRMRTRELTATPNVDHFYTSRLIYQDTDCPGYYSYYETYIPAMLEKMDIPDQVDYQNQLLDDKLHSRDTEYYDQVRTLYKDNCLINPATCSYLVFAILEKRALNIDEIQLIADCLGIPIGDFQRNRIEEKEQLKAEFAIVDNEYRSENATIDHDNYIEKEALDDKYYIIYNQIRDKYDILKPFYYKNKKHPFLNLYRNVIYNKLIEQGLFQIGWAGLGRQPLRESFDAAGLGRQPLGESIDAGARQPLNASFNIGLSLWVHIGYQKLLAGGDSVYNYYEYIDCSNNKCINSMFELFPSDTIQEEDRQSRLAILYKQIYYKSLDFMYHYSNSLNKIKLLFQYNGEIVFETEINKAILIFHSDYFKALFEGGFSSVEECILDVEENTGEIITQYFKTGVIQLQPEMQLNAFIDKYMLKYLDKV